MADEDNKIAPWKLYLIMAMMLILGTCNTIVTKAQDEVITKTVDVKATATAREENPDAAEIYQKYSHPYF